MNVLAFMFEKYGLSNIREEEKYIQLIKINK